MTAATVQVPLHEIAHAREGDKGNWATISLIAYAPEAYDILVREVTKERVLAHFAHRHARDVQRYELPNIQALNFVVEDVLEGGVNGSLNLDGHGKTLSFHLLAMTIEMDETVHRTIRRHQSR